MFFRIKAASRLLFALLIILVLLIGGSVGYMSIEGYSFIDGLWMTVITVSTVGYGLVNNADLTITGKIFTIVLIITSIGTFAYGISAITSYFIAGQYVKEYKTLRNLNKISKMNNHIIVCGFGRVGQKVCEDLKSHGKEFLVIESDDKKADLLSEKYNYMTIHGNATSEDVLEKANIKSAKVLITTLPNDADNVYAVLSAKELNNDLSIISRASQKTSITKLRRAGANNVIMPDNVGGAHMASLVVNPDIMEFLDHISVQGPADVNLEEVYLQENTKDHTFDDLKDICKENNIQVNIIGFKGSAGIIKINPDGQSEVKDGCKLFVLGIRPEIEKFNRLVGCDFL